MSTTSPDPNDPRIDMEEVLANGEVNTPRPFRVFHTTYLTSDNTQRVFSVIARDAAHAIDSVHYLCHDVRQVIRAYPLGEWD